MRATPARGIVLDMNYEYVASPQTVGEATSPDGTWSLEHAQGLAEDLAGRFGGAGADFQVFDDHSVIVVGHPGSDTLDRMREFAFGWIARAQR